MPPVSGSGSSTVQFPNDVLAIIVSYLDKPSLLQIRFCCRWLAREAARYLFDEVRFQMHAKDLERVIAIANSSFIADPVKVLRLVQAPRLPEISLEDLCINRGNPTWMWVCPGVRNLIRHSKEKYDDQGEEFLRFRQQLFQEYEAQRNEPSLYDCLHAPGPSIPESVRTVPQDQDMSTSRLETATEDLRIFQKACTGFEDALQKFHDLRELHVDLILSDRREEIPWRSYTIGTHYDNFYGLGKKRAVSEETAPLSFVLRSLGKRNASSSNLTSLRLRLIGDDWWGPQDLKYAWIPPEEEDDEENHSRLSQVGLAKNLTLMDDALAYLTDIRITFRVRQEMPQFMAALARFLSKANGLARLELGVSDGSEHSLGEIDLLAEINNCALWSTITDLCLANFQFSETSILRMFSLAASSLRSVTLRCCMLLEDDSSWPHCYEKMRLIPFQVLNDLDFRECWQDLEHPELPDTPEHDWSIKDYCDRSVALYIAPDGHVGYSSSILDYILRRTESLPLLKRFSLPPVDRYGPLDWYCSGSHWPCWY